MFSSKTLLSLLLLTLSAVDATSLGRQTGKATLGFATRINARGTPNIAEQDRARAQAMKQAGRLGKRSTTFNVANGVVTYTAEIGVGVPATTYTLLIDTGSANTFVGANKSYVKTKTSKDTGESIFVSYGSGFFSGEEWLDTVTLAPGLVIHDQSIGVASFSGGFSNVDGILGVGPVDLTVDTVSNTNTVPTVSDNLLSQKKMSEEVLGVYFVPASEPNSTGELTFGGYDRSVVTSSMSYVPLTTTKPASDYWGIDGSVKYGSDTILSSTAGIVDTGTTLVLIATDALQKYQSKTGAVVDSVTGLLKITTAQYAKLQPLTFVIGGKSHALMPNAQIWPRSLNIDIGGDANTIYLVVGDIGSFSGGGLDFVIGYTFLERYYSVYDTTNKRFGFASTAYTKSNSN